MSNFEPHFNGGYRRIDGFERFDGQPKPSEQTFIGFEVSAVEDLILGTVVTGAPSGAMGTIIGIYEDDGTRGNDMIGVTKVTGTFAVGDTLTTVTNADEDIVPDGFTATDPGAALIINNIPDIDEGVDMADSIVGLECVRNEWPGGAGVDTVTINMADLPAHVTTINDWTLRVRARVIRKGNAIFRDNSVYVPSPEADDTTTYTFTFAPAGDSESLTFTDVDAGMGFITREISTSGSATTPAGVNAASVTWVQTAFAMLGELFDGLTLEVDAIDVVFDYDGDVDILSDPVQRDAPTLSLENDFLLAAQDEYRSDIGVVPGSGPVRSAWQLSALGYAVRDNVGATAGILHVESAAGWTTTGVTMADYIFFTAGLAAFASVVEGDTLTGAVSGATATIHRIVLNGGSNAFDGSGEGYIVLTGVAGGPFGAAETLESPAATAIATSNGANVTLAFSDGGRYEWVNHNFFAGADTLRAYGVNSVDTFAFELDENSIVSPIFLPTTVAGSPAADEGAPPGAPFLIEEHRNHIWLGYPGGRYVNSVIGEPLRFTGFLGSNEFGAGGELTGLVSVVGSVLVVLTERESRGLFGFDETDFELKLLAEKSGSRLYGSQKIDTVYSLDDLGISSLARSDAFGDFIGATVSQLIQPLVTGVIQDSFTASSIVRASNQYRIYFNDGTAFVMYIPAAGDMNRTRSQMGTATRTGVQFGVLTYPFPVNRIWNTEDGDGMEISYFTTDDAAGLGFVYQDRKGFNFDGEDIVSFVRSAFNFFKSPSVRKRFRRVDLETDAQRPTVLKFIADLSFGVSDSEAVRAKPDIAVAAGGGFWDSDNWDEFFWDGQPSSNARANIRGTGEAAGFVIQNESSVTRPFILQGLTVHYEPRRLQR